MNLVFAKCSVSAVAAATAMAAFVVMLSAPRDVRAASYSCFTSGSCPNQASCDGSYYTRDGCTIRCFNPGDDSGELVPAGSATCAPSGGGGGGDGGGDWWCGTYCW